MKIAVTIPTYCEKENVGQLVDRVFDLKISGLEIIFVDDNSSDGTAEEIKKLQGKFPIHLIQRPGKMGLGSAYITGFKKAFELGAEHIFEMDADLSHDPMDIPRLLQACYDGADLSIGSRKIAGGKIIGWHWRRIWMSNGAMFFARTILGLKAKDVTAGFRCYRRKVLKTIDLDSIKSNGYAFQEEMLFKTQKAGFKIAEVPVTFTDRARGKSKLNFKDIIEFFTVMLKLKFTRYE